MEFYSKPFDKDGKIAFRGNIIPHLLRWMACHPYLTKKPPKSTGREVFGERFVRDILRKSKGHRKEDIITTVSEFTSLGIYQSYLKFIRKQTRLDELLVSGGGSHNLYVMNALQRYFAGVTVHITDELDLSADAKEAICFALLANETIAGHPGNVTGATGAARNTVLGTICVP
ncbi:MAG: anhydro-N-acetylmuramic acid kinase, partial [Ignavibacteria bacterium]|nr:anhydro-N-acetylmuramic acid kinase [Ignavibacteria bacterium]